MHADPEQPPTEAAGIHILIEDWPLDGGSPTVQLLFTYWPCPSKFAWQIEKISHPACDAAEQPASARTEQVKSKAMIESLITTERRLSEETLSTFDIVSSPVTLEVQVAEGSTWAKSTSNFGRNKRPQEATLICNACQ